MNRERPRILLGITGSIAAVKGPRLALLLSQSIKADVKVVLTRTVEQYFWKGGVTESYDEDAWKEFWAVVKSCENVKAGDTEVKDWVSSNGSISIHCKCIAPLVFISLQCLPIVVSDAEEEWNNYENLSSPVLHIELRNWADTLLIAPLSAHTLAKIANGLCDDLLSCIVRAWDFGQRKDQNGNPNGKPLILCPAMNTAMWDHVLTRRQLYLIRGFGGCADDKSLVTVVEPVVKKLACGDVGAGALAELEDIVCCVRNCLDAEPISSSGNVSGS
jgi:phosphopantothenoylcysteine synthetase/decarboxylase